MLLNRNSRLAQDSVQVEPQFHGRAFLHRPPGGEICIVRLESADRLALAIGDDYEQQLPSSMFCSSAAARALTYLSPHLEHPSAAHAP
jgi:hypothetical protein